ncbi:MAG: hypothetical protein IKP40_03465 [Clostridia bacterium]|nr:hypothetical protein [Clostridia bacterium]
MTMTRRQRVEAVLRGEKPDRTPVCFWHHFGVLSPEQTVQAHVRWLEESGIDLLKMMSDEFFIYPLNGAKTPADFLALRPQGPDSGYVRGQAERAGQIAEALQGTAVCLHNIFSPYANLKHAIGQDEALALLKASPEAFGHALEVILEDTLLAERLLLTESGIDGLMLCLQGAEEGLFSEEDYLRFLRPGEQAIVDTANALSDRNLLHLCGWDGTPDLLERWRGYPSAMVNWDVDVERVKLKDGKAYFGDRVLLGGLNNRPGSVMASGSREEIQSAVRKALSEAGDARFILGADCSLPSDIDPVRVRWAIEALG